MKLISLLLILFFVQPKKTEKLFGKYYKYQIIRDANKELAYDYVVWLYAKYYYYNNKYVFYIPIKATDPEDKSNVMTASVKIFKDKIVIKETYSKNIDFYSDSTITTLSFKKNNYIGKKSFDFPRKVMKYSTPKSSDLINPN
jgi:hypothetical protein